jgi:hypothetical protein
MHQGDENFEGGAKENKEPGHIQEDLSKIMVYGHSAMCSDGIIVPIKDYISILRSDKFYIYQDIYSLKPQSNFIVHLGIFDCTETIPDLEKVVFFEKLDDNYRMWLSSFLLVFNTFKRNILNFPPEPISLESYYDMIRIWLPEYERKNKKKKNKKGKSGEGV